MEGEIKIQRIRESRDFLDEQGYYVSNLWMIDDVLEYELEDGTKPNLTEDEARWVLSQVLSSEWITEQVFISIREHIELLISKNK